MKILLTNSPLHFSHGHTFTQSDWQTLVLPYLAGIVGNGHDVRLLDNMHGSFLKSNRIMSEIKDFKPDLVGFSIIASRDIFTTMEVIKKVRDAYPQLKLMAGGQAGTYYKKWLLEEGIDFVVRKEGEKTLKELVETMKSDTKDYSSIAGISYRIGEESLDNPDRPMIRNLDESPLPRWDLMPKIKSKWFNGRYSGSIETSRGCPFDCNFCAITAFWQRSFRQKSNDRLIEELKILKREGRTHVYLADDSFGVNAKKHVELFERMLKENLDVKFFTQIRADTVANNPDMVALAARAGLYGVLVGFDTYETDVFNDVTKTTSRDLNIAAATLLRKNKIAIFGSHIYGLPAQKRPEDFENTFQLGRKNSDLFRMPYFSPLPFTKGYEELVRVNPHNLTNNISEQYKKDFRPRIRSGEEKKRMDKGYGRYVNRHNFSSSEIFEALFHPDPIVRTLKRQGYIGVARHNLYKLLRKIGLTDI